jgi:hypothetical protein
MLRTVLHDPVKQSCGFLPREADRAIMLLDNLGGLSHLVLQPATLCTVVCEHPHFEGFFRRVNLYSHSS